MVLADAGYGDEAGFRDWLAAQPLPYVLGVRAGTSVWWGEHQPAPGPSVCAWRPRTRVKRDARHQPIAVLDLARALPGKAGAR